MVRALDPRVLQLVRSLAMVVVVLLWGAIPLSAGLPPVTSPVHGASPETPRIEGPFVEGNLAAFLLRGDDTLAIDELLTLDEALEKKSAVVRETGDVNDLIVENLGDTEVFIEAGDIVKGGRQDRVLTTDMLLPPKSGPVSIAAFCVESGRWSSRGEEPPAHFASAKMTVPSPMVKRVATREGDQREVWSKVGKLQADLSSATRAPVAAEESPTSLQLTLEGGVVEAAVEPYLRALDSLVDDRIDVVGFAFAVNGELIAVDVYGAARLARKRWQPALRAAAVEAVRRGAGDAVDAAGATAPSEQLVTEVLARLASQPAELREARSDLEVLRREDATFDLIDNRRASDDELVHRAILTKKE